MTDELPKLINAALARRRALLTGSPSPAVRLFHGGADGLDGLAIERFGAVLIVQIQEGPLEERLEDIRRGVEALHTQVGTQGVYLKRFLRDRSAVSESIDAAHREPMPWIGRAVDPEIEIEEGPLRFLIGPYDGFSVGLFLEHRDNRGRVARLAAGRGVLNLFAYTCGFSVAALKGGATFADSVDLSRRYLEWGKRNFQANGLSATEGRFFCCDVREYFKRAQRQKKRYGMIVIDPPTFAKMRRPRRVFVLKDELEKLIEEAVKLLEPLGYVLLAVNDRQIGVPRMEKAMKEAHPHRRARIIERPTLPLDFRGDADYSKTLIAQYE